MKRFAVLLVLVVCMLCVSAMPALASSLHVSAKASALADHVAITAHLSKSGRVKAAVYLDGQRVSTLKVHRRSRKLYTATWNLTDANGAAVQAGTYTVRITATRGRIRRVANRTVAVTTSTVDQSKYSSSGGISVGLAKGFVVGKATTPVTKSRWCGFFQQGMTSANLVTTTDPLTSLESQVGARSAVVNWFESDTDPDGFPANKVKAVYGRGSIPMVTLELWSTQTGGVDSIINGTDDAYLTAWAQGAKSYGKEMWIRPFHEMNSNWYPWAGGTSGNSSAKVVAAWIHVYNLFHAAGATNVKFVWCVNNESVPNTTDNQIAKYYPGDAYVDILAIDAYNFGTAQSGSSWRSFSTAVSGAYTKVTGLNATKRLIVAETGCVEQGGNKAQWITDMFSAITTTYTRIEGVCWFNVNDSASSGTDWRVDSSSTSLTAFQSAVARGY